MSTPEYDAWKYPDAFDEYHFSHSPALLKGWLGSGRAAAGDGVCRNPV